MTPLFPRQYAQELLSTFSTALGEVALQPSTGGTFVVEILFFSPPFPSSPSSSQAPLPSLQTRVLWDRKTDGGFPETKELKRRVRDAIEPGRDLGHVDRDHHRGAAAAEPPTGPEAAAAPAPAATTMGTAAGGENEKEKDGEGLPRLPSRAELQAAGQAGGGGPGEGEAAAQLVGDLRGRGEEGKEEERNACEDCA